MIDLPVCLKKQMKEVMPVNIMNEPRFPAGLLKSAEAHGFNQGLLVAFRVLCANNFIKKEELK